MIERRRPSPGRAFTMMELAISLAAMGIIALAATMLFSLYLGLTKKARLETQLRQRAETALEYLVNETRRAGGRGAQPSASVIVENDCSAARGFPDCDHTDRITMVQPLVGYGKCKVVSDSGSTIDVNTVRVVSGSPPVCCLNGAGFRRQVAFQKDDVVTPAFLEGAGGCTFRYHPIVGAPPGSLQDASITMADVKTFYREPGHAPGTAGRLAMHMNLDGDGSLVGERLYLANDILDLQARRDGLMLGLSIVAGEPHDAGTLSVETAFSTSRLLSRTFIAREATARLALRDSR